MQSRGPGPTVLGYKEQRSPAHTGKEASRGRGGSGRERVPLSFQSTSPGLLGPSRPFPALASAPYHSLSCVLFHTSRLSLPPASLAALPLPQAASAAAAAAVAEPTTQLPARPDGPIAHRTASSPSRRSSPAPGRLSFDTAAASPVRWRWRRPLNQAFPQASRASKKACAHLRSCLQVFPELLYIMEGRRFKFLGEILEQAGCWAREGQRKEGHPTILPPAPDCGAARRNLRT